MKKEIVEILLDMQEILYHLARDTGNSGTNYYVDHFARLKSKIHALEDEEHETDEKQ